MYYSSRNPTGSIGWLRVEIHSKICALCVCGAASLSQIMPAISLVAAHFHKERGRKEERGGSRSKTAAASRENARKSRERAEKEQDETRDD